MKLEELYKKTILKHYRNPKNLGALNSATISVEDENSLCGDNIQLRLLIQEDAVDNIKFEGDGCSISIASASVMTEIVKGKSVDEIKKITKQILKVMNECEHLDFLDKYTDLSAFKDIIKHKARSNCAMLPWSALEKALKKE